jgi:hypothetical protein
MALVFCERCPFKPIEFLFAFFLLICVSFNNAVSSSDCVALSDMFNEQCIGRDMEGSGHVQI